MSRAFLQTSSELCLLWQITNLLVLDAEALSRFFSIVNKRRTSLPANLYISVLFLYENGEKSWGLRVGRVEHCLGRTELALFASSLGTTRAVLGWVSPPGAPNRDILGEGLSSR